MLGRLAALVQFQLFDKLLDLVPMLLAHDEHRVMGGDDNDIVHADDRPTSTDAAPKGQIDGSVDSRPQNLSSTCRNNDLDVTQARATVVMAGPCGTITVTASDASIYLETAAAIVVVGDHNTITAHDVGQLTLRGSRNTVLPGTVRGTTTDNGAGNTIVAS